MEIVNNINLLNDMGIKVNYIVKFYTSKGYSKPICVFDFPLELMN